MHRLSLWQPGRLRLLLLIVVFTISLIVSPTAHAQTAVTGTLTEFPVDSDPRGIVTGPDGNLWFAEAAANEIGRITPNGTVTEFPVPTADSNPIGITTGSDGNLWFTEYTANEIGRITPGGIATEFPIPTNSSSPYDIATGSDGNAWFTEQSGSNIGRITPNGTITEFPTPTANSEPECITAGPDGDVWFTEISGHKIGRITPNGTITEVVANNDTCITADPHGNLWYTEVSANKIGRITPSGTITEFPIPTIRSGSYGITAGPDGNIWFTENSKVARITPDGTITEFPTPIAASEPYGITTGPDGNIWFTEQSGNNIGRITVEPTATGFMAGYGKIKNTSEEHLFKLFCDPSKPDRLVVKWSGQHEFTLRKISSVVCTQDQTLPSDPAGFNTITGTGNGTYNGKPGATIQFQFTAGGGSYTHMQKGFASIKVTGADGAVKLNVAGLLSLGEQVSHK